MIASLRQTDRDRPTPRLIRIDMLTGDAAVLTHDTSPNLHPRLSPDETQVLFIGGRGDTQGAYVVPATGGTARSVLSVDGTVQLADWRSSDTIVYNHVTRVQRARVAVVH